MFKKILIMAICFVGLPMLIVSANASVRAKNPSESSYRTDHSVIEFK